MPLVKDGRIVADPYVRVTDAAPVADDAAVIVPAARFLAEAAGLAHRAAPTGVLGRTTAGSPSSRRGSTGWR
jgi:uncharacterized protein (DUF934 family)